MSSPPLTIRRISVWDMRRLFNEGKFIKKLRKEELTAQSVRCKAVDAGSPYIGRTIPIGSISQTLELFNKQNDLIAEIQRYIKPDGAIGASGKNDPKNLVVGNIFFRQIQKGKLPDEILSNKRINEILNKRGIAAAKTYMIGWYYLLKPPPR